MLNAEPFQVFSFDSRTPATRFLPFQIRDWKRLLYRLHLCLLLKISKLNSVSLRLTYVGDITEREVRE